MAARPPRLCQVATMTARVVRAYWGRMNGTRSNSTSWRLGVSRGSRAPRCPGFLRGCLPALETDRTTRATQYALRRTRTHRHEAISSVGFIAGWGLDRQATALPLTA